MSETTAPCACGAQHRDGHHAVAVDPEIKRSVLDRLVSDARDAGRTDARAIRSVRGTIDLPEDDADLAGADGFIRAQFEKSVRRPILVNERSSRYRAGRKPRG